MLLQAPEPSPYDLEFRILGFPVRISWTFWLMTAVIGYNIAMGIDDGFRGQGTPGMLPLLVMWAACVLVSIVIHELGHAVAFRSCGIESSIVLYHFGGLAIPHSTRSIGMMAKPLSPKENLMVSAAGPGAQLLFAALVIGVVKLSGTEVVGLPAFVYRNTELGGGAPIESAGLYLVVLSLVFVNLYWAVLNLVPIYPLDGGQIARELIVLMGGNVYQATVLSLVAVGLCVLWAFNAGHMMLIILFLSLGVGNWQSLQSLGRWR